VIGALGIGDRTGRAFHAEEVRLAQAFADQAAVALENARLFEEAHAQRERLSQIFDSTTDGMLFVRADGRVDAANRRAAELVGVEPDRLVGAGLLAVLGARSTGGEAERLFAASLRAVHEPEGAEGDLELVRPERVLHWITRPTRDAGGQLLGVTLTLQDVTKEREVSQMKSDFVSFVTHQLRTPLSGIKWLLELAAEEEGVPEGPRSYVRDAHSAAERLITLVNDLLDISRLERGNLDVSPRPTDLAALTADVVEEVMPLVRDKSHVLSLDMPEGLPAVAVDPQLMRQVIANLLSNAVKYTLPGGTIAVRLTRDGDRLCWAVRDSGIGVPRDAQERLFEKFFRADNVFAIETEGTGLGLYLVRLLVERFGGRVWCESEEGRGSTFLFTLPLAEADA
jgi:PAS domain S-box-containing protein